MKQVADIKAVEQVVTDRYAIYQGDACELIRAIPSGSVHYGLHSPPFEGLYKFSNFDRDISNNEGATFWEHYAFLIAELLRVTMPGRLHSVHVMQLPMSKIRHGHLGMRDFRGEVVRAYEDAGWIFAEFRRALRSVADGLVARAETLPKGSWAASYLRDAATSLLDADAALEREVP